MHVQLLKMWKENKSTKKEEEGKKMRKRRRVGSEHLYFSCNK